MEGTGEIKYPGQTKTSTAALQLTELSVKFRGRKPRKKNHLVLQVGGCAKGQQPVHGKHLQAKKLSTFLIFTHFQFLALKVNYCN
jgi:hypothetical protein